MEMDWNKLWKDALLNCSWRKQQPNSPEMWNKRAGLYDRSVRSTSRTAQTRRTIARLDLDSQHTVLDIGSGPGTLAVPLAKMVRHVTAVDPSKGMLDCLRENAGRGGLTNITCIHKSWEDVDVQDVPEQYDIVIAANSLIMPDMKEALRRMDHVARRRVYLFRFAGGQTWDYEEIWRRLYTEEYAPNPDYIYIVNILHQLGIYANIEILEHEFSQCFCDLDEAVKDRLGYFADPPAEAEQVIREYLSGTLEEEDGALWSRRQTKVAMMWWEK